MSIILKDGKYYCKFCGTTLIQDNHSLRCIKYDEFCKSKLMQQPDELYDGLGI